MMVTNAAAILYNRRHCAKSRDSRGWEVPMAGAPANVLNISRPPVFATAAEERLHRKRMLAAAFRDEPDLFE